MKSFQIHINSKCLVIMVLFLSVYVSPAQDIQPYRAQEIKPDQAKEVKPVKAREIEVDKAKEVKQYKAQEIRRSKPRVQRPTSGGGMKPTTTEEVVPQPDNSNKVQTNSDLGKEKKPAVNTDNQNFDGLYQYWVPGAAYTVADYANQQLILHTSAGTGVLPGGIQINADNTYVWNSSWDEKVIKGTWNNTGDQEYPIVLNKAQEGRSWKIGKSSDKNADITIWDGNTWYNGKKIK